VRPAVLGTRHIPPAAARIWGGLKLAWLAGRSAHWLRLKPRQRRQCWGRYTPWQIKKARRPGGLKNNKIIDK